MARRFVLASASPARLRLLRAAGLAPEVIVSGVDEEAVDIDDVPKLVQTLAEHKALAVAARPEAAGSLVLGCDSMLEFDGMARGKPATPDEAIERWRQMRGSEGALHTGHCVVDTSRSVHVSAVASTTVRFGFPSDNEIDAYVATGEPLGVAGAFTIDGLAAAFVDGIDGDHGTVIGVSMPLLRNLLGELGVNYTTLWADE